MVRLSAPTNNSDRPGIWANEAAMGRFTYHEYRPTLRASTNLRQAAEGKSSKAPNRCQ